jgi:hypothetical protein
MEEIQDWEWQWFEIVHNPALFQMFITPTNEAGTDLVPFDDWFEEDHWSEIRSYQMPMLSWDHLLPSRVPVDRARRANYHGIDRKSLGDINVFGGRGMSKSFGFNHDALQTAIARPGEITLVTSRDEGHLQQRVEGVFTYADKHPLIKMFVGKPRRTAPYPQIEWTTGHITNFIFESTNGEGENYLGHHTHRALIDEIQLTSNKALMRLHDTAIPDEGHVVRTFGVSDGRRDTPAHDFRNDPKLANKLYVLPQYLRESWTPLTKQEAIYMYHGNDTLEYVTNVEAQEGEPTSGVWNMSDIRACVEIMLADLKDTKKAVSEKRRIACPIVVVNDEDIKTKDIGDIEYPKVRELEKTVVLTMDVGKSEHPSVIGIWGIDEDIEKGVNDLGRYIPRQWGKVVLWRIGYLDQAKIALAMIRKYGASKFGIDKTGSDGDAIVENMRKFNEVDGLDFELVPFDARKVLDVEVTKISEDDKGVKKVGAKYFVTERLMRRFAERFIHILYDMQGELEFESEVSKVSGGVNQMSYAGPQGDHTIDMMRILEYVLYKMGESKKRIKKAIKFAMNVVRMGRI